MALPRSPRPVRASVLAFVGAAVLGACATAAMGVPADLASAAPLPVEGRGRLFEEQAARFGPWEATDVDRSWTRGSGWSVGAGPVSGGTRRASQDFSFRFLEDGREVTKVGCAALGSRSEGLTAIVGIELNAREALECAPVDTTFGEPAWDLVIEAKGNDHLRGHLRIGDARFDVAATGPGGGIAPATAYGFVIRDGERAIAAVETVNEGSVRLAPALAAERRTAVAAAAAALLLYERIGAEL